VRDPLFSSFFYINAPGLAPYVQMPRPSAAPTVLPTVVPTALPTTMPTPNPTAEPTPLPTERPGIIVVNVQIYSSYNGGSRAANYNIDYSDDNTNWVTAFTGNMNNGGVCGIRTGSVQGSGTYGKHVYWRFQETTATVNHFPRAARIDFIDSSSGVRSLITFTSDNCVDQGKIPCLDYATTISGTFSS